MIRTIGIVQARTSSTRLPGKVLQPVLGLPLLCRQLERLKRCREIEKFVVATSDGLEDRVILDLSLEMGVDVFQGNLNDVLDRFYQAARLYLPEHIVRLTGDCPLADPNIIDSLVRFYFSGKYDYASNCINPTLPDGLDAEIFSFPALERAWYDAASSSEREHVTPYIKNHPELFRIGSQVFDRDFSALRWTVDNPEDLVFVRRVYQEIYPSNPDFVMEDILDLLSRNPSLKSLNAHIGRNEGFANSLAQERAGEVKGK